MQRVRVALELGRIKRELGHPIRSPEREAVVLESAAKMMEGVMDRSAVVRLFQAIIEETRATEECNV